MFLLLHLLPLLFFFFFFNDTATTEIYTLSLTTLFRSLILEGESNDVTFEARYFFGEPVANGKVTYVVQIAGDRKSTRLNSSHLVISYAVFCLKKKKRQTKTLNLDKKRESSRI